MGGHKIDAEASNTTENGEIKLQKKQKRKLEETGAELGTESVNVVNKKKNKEKQEVAEVLNGSGEIYITKKEKEETFNNGSTETSRKREHCGVRSENATEEIRHGSGVVVSGKNVKDSKYATLNSFAESGLPSEVMECCKNFNKPSPIQSHSWPFLLDGRDFIGIAATGSGKTLAYGVPAIMNVLSRRKSKIAVKRNPLCLVLSPTRELAQQISDVLCDAGRSCGVQSICIYGGTSKGPQISALKSGVDIVIGTPGRLKDLIEMGVCHLREVSYVVLDEADRMLDMGFEPEVRSLLSQTCSVRQMAMFSASWPLPVHQLAQEFMDPSPVKVVVGSEDLAANHDVLQIVEVLEDRARDERLQNLLEKYHKSRKNRVLVFVLYKKEASRVENMLHKRGWKVVSISGDKAQHARTQALSLFKEGSCPLMIATDVAARGLDIPDVEVVINYSFPLTTGDYVHRIGRTGHAGKKGVAHTFFMKENKGLAEELVNILREALQVVPDSLLKFGMHLKKTIYMADNDGGAGPADGRTYIWTHDDIFMPDHNKVVRYITSTFSLQTCNEGHSWKYVTPDQRQWYWEEFVKKYRWDEEISETIRQMWYRNAATIYRRTIHSLRTAGRYPDTVSEARWAGWTAAWQDHSWLDRAGKNKTNRSSESAGVGTGTSKHIVGSKTYSAHYHSMRATQSTDPSLWDLYLHTHRRPDGSFVHQSMEALRDVSVTPLDDDTIPDQPSSEEEVTSMFKNVVGGRKKDMMYGCGSMASTFYHEEMTPRSRGGKSSSSQEIQSLMEEVEQQNRVIEYLRLDIQASQRREDEMRSRMSSIEDQIRLLVAGMPHVPPTHPHTQSHDRGTFSRGRSRALTAGTSRAASLTVSYSHLDVCDKVLRRASSYRGFPPSHRFSQQWVDPSQDFGGGGDDDDDYYYDGDDDVYYDDNETQTP